MTRRRLAHLAALLLMGCAPSPPPAVSAPPPSPAAPPPAASPPAPPPLVAPSPAKAACRDGTIVVEAPPTDTVCADPNRFWAGSCEVPFEVRFHNCTASPLEIAEVTLAADGSTRIQWSFDPGTGPGPGEVWTFARSILLPAGTYELRATFASAGAPAAEAVDLVVTSTTLDAAKAACVACSGDFGGHGMLGTVGCLCRTVDAGQPCDDGNDCEGKCISRDGGFQCSEHVTVFGCHAYLPRGWSEQPHPKRTRIPSICVD